MNTDLELVEDVRAGDRRSFSELVRRHQRSILRLALRYLRDPGLAEDVVQESFIKAYEKIASFEGRSSFKSWLFQIAVNTAKNKLRSLPQEHVNIEDVRLGIGAGAENDLVRIDIGNAIRAEIDALPERQRIALTLRIFEELSFKEIATIMSCPYDTAKANYRHALLRLRERIEGARAGAEWKDFESLSLIDTGRFGAFRAPEPEQ